MHRSSPAIRVIVYALLIGGSMVFLIPFLWMITSALKASRDIFTYPPTVWPKPVVWSNFSEAVTFIPFARYLGNTLVICIGSMVGSVISASLVAYSLAILRWRGRGLAFKLLLATMLLPPQVTMIPVFVIWRKLGLIDTFWPLILPAFFGAPFFIFLVRQFYLGVPYELVEAARIDGCREWSVYWRIVAPLSVPVLTTVALFSFIWTWTDFLTPIIYLQDQSKYTLSLGLQQFQETNGAQWGMLMAASVLITLPMIILFFCLQRLFVEGIATTGLKG